MAHKPHMVDCWQCHEPFDIGGGYILLHVCPACMKAARERPEAYVQRNGLLVPNPDAG